MKDKDILPISCYIRALNEERLIADVISKAKELCKEVVVIDSGSSDGTVEIARRHGAKVIHQEWLGNGYQKKIGERHCSCDWLLDLDADEVLSSELMREIRHEFSGAGPDCDVYKLPLTIVDPAGRVWKRSCVSRRAKLYNRNRVAMPSEIAWDQLVLSPNMSVRSMESPLYHHAFTDLGHLARKQESAMRTRVQGMAPRSAVTVRLHVAAWFPFYFFKYYTLRGLWRVGLYGMSFAFVCAFSRWLREVKLYERDCLGLTGKSPVRNITVARTRDRCA